MLIIRRRSGFFHNLSAILNIKCIPEKFSTSLKYGLSAQKSKNPIMIFLVIRSLLFGYKLPKIHLLRTQSNIHIKKNNNITINISNFLINKILNDILFTIRYRYYPFKEKLFGRNATNSDLFFIKLPLNVRLQKLEEIESGDAVNFKLSFIGKYTYLEIIYILNLLGFTNIHESTLVAAEGLDFDNVIFLKNYKTNVDFFFKI
jgi:hypothetical protein